MDLEYVALKQNFMHVGADLAAERSKCEQIGLELLNLVNAKQALETQNQRLQTDLARLQSRHDDMQTTQLGADQTRTSLQQQAIELKAQNERCVWRRRSVNATLLCLFVTSSMGTTRSISSFNQLIITQL
jgi:hypothetical protein